MEAKLRAAGVRVETDLRNEKINYKVREHSLAKVPHLAVVGKREAEEGTVAIRTLGEQQQLVLPVAEAITMLQGRGDAAGPARPRPHCPGAGNGGVAALAIAVLALIAGAIGYRNATAEPVVRRAYVGVAGWPADTPPVTVLALADLHMAGPDMPPERLRGILVRLNALRPDLILVAGDLVSEKALATRHYSADEIVAVLATLEAPLGVLAVPGQSRALGGCRRLRACFCESRASRSCATRPCGAARCWWRRSTM